jgi:hypothetical protein
MKNEMRLQGIGLVEGTEAGKIQVGDILRWNHGGLSKVVSFELTKTGKTIICQVEVINSRTGEKELYERKMRTNRLVNIVASANTNNDFNLQFDPIEEVPEAEEVAEAPEAKEIADFKRYSELLEKVYGMKTKATKEEQEELERLAYKLELNGVSEAISNMNFNRLQKLVEVAEAPEAEKVAKAKRAYLIEALINASSPEEEAFIKERLEAPEAEKVKVTWFDYSIDKGFTKEITSNQLEWLKKANHIEIDEIEFIKTSAYTG